MNEMNQQQQLNERIAYLNNRFLKAGQKTAQETGASFSIRMGNKIVCSCEKDDDEKDDDKNDDKNVEREEKEREEREKEKEDLIRKENE